MKKQIITAAFMACTLFASAQAQLAAPATDAGKPQMIEKVTAKPGELIIAYEKWRLPNGMIVIIHEDHSDPIVHVDVTYHVGSARETPGKSGFAHFFEHMMFQGSEHVRDEEHFKIVTGAGGDMNGSTNRDRTNYYETLPKNYLETALWLESDRMAFLLDSVTQKKFEVQRSTVKNEKDQNINNIPYGRTDIVKDEILYPKNHPYNWPTIGYEEDLNVVDVDDLKNFFLRWYGPNNASLTVAGDVNPQEVLALATKYFGSVPRGPEVKKQRVEMVRLADNVYANYGDNIIAPLTMMVFPTVPSYHADEPALDILSSILSNGNNSIMYKNLVKSEKALQVFAYNSTAELAGEFTIQYVSYPYSEIKPVDEIKNVLNDFEKAGVSDDDLARSKALVERQLIGSMSSISDKASLLAQWNYLFPNKSMNLNEESARYKRVTKDDVMRVFRTYIKDKNSAIVTVFEKSANAAANKDETPTISSSGVASKGELEYKGLSYVKPVDDFNRVTHPEIPGSVTPVVPKVYKQKFDNGLVLMGTKNSEVPLVTILFNIRGGNLITNDAGKAGIAALTAAMMEESTQNYTSEQFSNELEKLGSSISFGAGKENTSITVSARRENLDATLKLVEEKLLRPKFTSEEFRLNEKRVAENIRASRVNATEIASKAYAKLLYGKNSVYAEPANGTIQTLKSMSVKDVQSYYDKYYSPSLTTVVVVGDIDQNELMPKLEFLKKWAKKDVQIPAVVMAPAPDKQVVYIVDKYKAKQSEIRVGYMSLPYDYNGKYFKAGVMNYPLGGNFNSRLNLNLREEKGFTYGIRSGFVGGKNIGPYTVNVGVRSTATDSALKEIMYELKTYREGGVKQEELDYAKKSLTQSDALRYETQYDKASFISQLAYYDLPMDYIEQQNRILQTLSKQEIDALAKELLPTEKMVILVVGDKDKIQPGLEKLGYKVVEYKMD